MRRPPDGSDRAPNCPPMTARPSCPVPVAARIVVLLHDFGAGGVERIAVRLANAWAAAGREVTILCGCEQGPLRATVAPACRVQVCSPPVPRGPLSRLRLRGPMARGVAALAPDIVFVPGNFHIPLLPAIAARNPRPGLVAKLSNPIRRADRTGFRRWFFEAKLRRQLRSADRLIAMCPALAEEARLALRDARLLVIAEPNLDAAPAPAERPAADPRQILAIGRLVAQKDFALAVATLAELRDRDLQLTLVGDGPERAAILAAAQALGVADRLHLAGYAADVRPALRAARLLLLSSRFEGYPAVVVEALAEGVPVVATPCSPALAGMIASADCGEIAADHRPASLAAAVRRVLDRPPPDRAALAATVARHDIDIASARYLALFDQIAAARLPA